jgi:hypothetical protein
MDNYVVGLDFASPYRKKSSTSGSRVSLELSLFNMLKNLDTHFLKFDLRLSLASCDVPMDNLS